MYKPSVVGSLRAGLFAAMILSLINGAAGLASGQVTNPPTVYNDIPNGLLAIPPTKPGNITSAGFEALGLQEFGDGLNLAPGPRFLTTTMVVMSSFACPTGHFDNPSTSPNACVTPAGSYTVEPGITVPTFSQAITLNIYRSNGAIPPEPGPLLATATQTFQIPYRPSASAACDAVNAGGWFSPANGACYSGLANKITFDLTSLAVLLPDQIIVGVTYNTSTAGYHPLGTGNPCNATVAGCPYDSLNVSADNSAATAIAGGGVTLIGSPIDPNGVYVNFLPADVGNACSPVSPAAVGNAFLLDTPCWTGQHPEIMVNAALASPDTYQIDYLPGALGGGIAGGYIDITNDGSLGADSFGPLAGTTGRICANIYVFTADEQESECCSCLVTPNALVHLTAADLTGNPGNGVTPTLGVVVKLLATIPGSSAVPGTNAGPFTGSTCNAAFPFTGANFAPGMRAWSTKFHSNSTTAPTSTNLTETTFSKEPLSAGELAKLTNLCQFLSGNQSGAGLCKACTLGGLGGVKK